MPKRVQIRRGTTAQHATFTGAVGEVTYDTDKKGLVVHDGVTAGGISLVDFLKLFGSASTFQVVGTAVEIDGGELGNPALPGLVVINDLLVDEGAATVNAVIKGLTLKLTTTAYAASIDINFGHKLCNQTISLTGNLTFTGSGYVAGVYRLVRLVADASLRTLTFPAGWVFIGAAAPANIAASKRGLLEIWSYGTTEADVIARWTVQP